MNKLTTYLTSLIERRVGTYVACSYTSNSCRALGAWVAKQSIISKPLTASKYHTTILYSRTQLREIHGDIEDNPGWFFTLKAFSLYPANGPKATKGAEALVIILEAPELINLHIRCRVAGGTHDYDDYRPHVTLSYNVSNSFDITKLELPDLKLEVEKVYAEPLNLNWRKDEAMVSIS